MDTNCIPSAPYFTDRVNRHRTAVGHVRPRHDHGLGRSIGWVGFGWAESQQHSNLSAESAYCGTSGSFY